MTADPYRGPPITIDSTGSRHRIVLEAPSSGWTIAFDNAKRTFDHTDVFITITRPDPAYMHAQGVVRQYLESMVDSKDRMTTYARVHDFGKKSGNYQKATETGK